jgi:hypothetical protein
MAYTTRFHDTSEATFVERDIDQPSRPKYHSHDAPTPLFPRGTFPEEVEQVLASLEASGGSDNVSGHLHYDEPVGDPLERLTNVCDALMGDGDGRRRRHSPDSRSVPLPSEISSCYFPNRRPTAQDMDDACTPGMPLLGGDGRRPSQVVLDGARALRDRTRGEIAALSDLQDQLNDYWDRAYDADPHRRR